MHALVHQTAWEDVRQMLEQELDETVDRLLNTLDTNAVHELRGRARALTEFLEVARTTKETLEKLSRKP